MNKPNDPENSPNESLADVLPAPVNDDRLPYVAELGLGSLTFVVTGVGALVLLGGSMMPCVGATRSTKLEWEKRKLQMDQAVREIAQSDDVSNGQPDIGKNN